MAKKKSATKPKAKVAKKTPTKTPARIRKVRAVVTIGFPHPEKKAGELVQSSAVVINGPEKGHINDHRAALKEEIKKAGKTRVHPKYERVEIWNSDGIQMSGHFVTKVRAEKRSQAEKEARAHDAKRLADDTAFVAKEATKKANSELAKAKEAGEKSAAAAKDLKGATKEAGLKEKDLIQDTPEEKVAKDDAAREASLAEKNKADEKKAAEENAEAEKLKKAKTTVANENAKWEDNRRVKLRGLGQAGSTGDRKTFTKAGRAKLRAEAVNVGLELGGNEQAGELIEKIIAHEAKARSEKKGGSDEERVNKILGK